MSRIALVEFLQRSLAGFWESVKSRGSIECLVCVREDSLFLY